MNRSNSPAETPHEQGMEFEGGCRSRKQDRAVSHTP